MSATASSSVKGQRRRVRRGYHVHGRVTTRSSRSTSARRRSGRVPATARTICPLLSVESRTDANSWPFARATIASPTQWSSRWFHTLPAGWRLTPGEGRAAHGWAPPNAEARTGEPWDGRGVGTCGGSPGRPRESRADTETDRPSLGVAEQLSTERDDGVHKFAWQDRPPVSTGGIGVHDAVGTIDVADREPFGHSRRNRKPSTLTVVKRVGQERPPVVR